MLVFKKRSKDPYISGKIQEAILCKMWGCPPSKLDNESAEDIDIHTMIYAHMMKENPMFG